MFVYTVLSEMFYFRFNSLTVCYLWILYCVDSTRSGFYVVDNIYVYVFDNVC